MTAGGFRATISAGRFLEKRPEEWWKHLIRINKIISRGRIKMYFEWKDAYSVNVAEIDKQHKKMFEIGRRISDLVLAKDEFDHYDEIMDILKELTEYTIYHFGYEERLMKQHGYKELDSHQFEHVFLTKKIIKLQEKDIDTNQKGATIDLIAFVSDWIAGHILQTDMKYRDYFKAMGVR
jgi:hemerythrin